MRIGRAPVIGSLVGLLFSLAVANATRQTFPAGVERLGPDAGGEHLLFIVSLPWSVLVWLAGLVTIMVRGADGVPAGLFFAMPVAAGAGWGWLIAQVRHRARAVPRRHGN